MLYKKNDAPSLSDELFRNPTAEYRGTPFWAWNCELSEDELLWQIDRLKEMGFGGFHMHPRAGFSTVYLSDEHMRLIRSCTEKAKDNNMLAWLYDEDRWSSGFAGGYITKNRANSAKFLRLAVDKPDGILSKEEAIPAGKPYFLAAYDVILNDDGTLKEYRKIGEADAARGTKWYACVCAEQPSGWRNGQTYADLLSKEAMDEFIKVTYDTYNEKVGEYFGEEIPAIFTDEPHVSQKTTLKFAKEPIVITLPWTTDFDKYYSEHCGIDILAHLPELLWELPGSVPSKARYHYHDLISELFASSFADNCGKWCDEHNIKLTGHMLGEQSLYNQATSAGGGDAMRAMRRFGIPGIDMLCDAIELCTAKQAQSVCHQNGTEGMLSELYGVTGWDFDFRGHKFQGDWQAALGVTVRVPHLSWVSMKGSAKRDYPASIHYQSPWYKEYKYIEDHYARINTALTRGKALVNVGVIHPIESYWISFGPSDATDNICAQLESNFTNIIEYLLFGTIDFDFINESMLPSQCGEISDRLAVGEMNYSVILVPGCLTLRRSTLDILKKFRQKGGRVIFVGDCPKYIDAEISDEITAFYGECEHCDFNKASLLAMLSDERTVEIKNKIGTATPNLVYQMRRDNGADWLFIAHAKKEVPTAPDHILRGVIRDNVRPQPTVIRIRGEYEPIVYNTLIGEKETIDYRQESGFTIIEYTFYSQDSLLLKLTPSKGELITAKKVDKPMHEIRIMKNVAYELEEPNVYLLDMAEYSTDGGKSFCETEEIIRIDKKIREIYDYPLASGEDIQPWAIKPEKIEHFPILKFTIESELAAECHLAYEYAEEVVLNGERVDIRPDGYFVDHEIHSIKLPALKVGTNELLVKVPIGRRVSIENFFLLGNFGVKVSGCEKLITSLPEKLGFSSITAQGLPFYGGNVIYKTKVTLPECSLKIRANYYRGALIKVLFDGKEAGRIAFNPFCVDIGDVDAGEHEVSFILYGNRYNTFGALHDCGDYRVWYGPDSWYSEGDRWSYDYQLKDTGILASPIFECTEK